MRKRVLLFPGAAIAWCALCALLLFAPACADAASPVSVSTQSASAGKVSNGRQQISFNATFKNVSRGDYIKRINHVEVSVRGFFKNREEKYERKVDVDWAFSPALAPGNAKSLKITFNRKVEPSSGMYPYDRVEIKVLRINYAK